MTTRVWALVRGAERHWLRPLLQGLRIPRFRRAQSRRPSAATEELLVALLRSRLREGADASGVGDPSAALPAAGAEADALVHGLLAAVVGPNDAPVADPGSTGAVTLPIGLPVSSRVAEGRRRAA